jgi:hypothetical protein
MKVLAHVGEEEDFAAGYCHGGVQGGRLTAARQGAEDDFRAVREAANDTFRSVGGAVRNDQDFQQFGGVVQGQDGLQFGGHPGFAVIDRQDHGDSGAPWRFAHRPRPPSRQEAEQQRVAEEGVDAERDADKEYGDHFPGTREHTDTMQATVSETSAGLADDALRMASGTSLDCLIVIAVDQPNLRNHYRPYAVD